MNSSRRDFLLRSGLVSLGGTGLLISACGGGGGGTGGGGEGLLNYGSQELPTKAYGAVPTVRSASGSITTTTNLTLPGVATIVGSKCHNISGHSLSIKASLDVAKAVTFIATVPAEITSRISYGIEVLVSSIQDSGKVHVAIDLPVEMQSKDPNTIVVGAHLIFADSDGFVALGSAVSDDKRTVGVDVPASVFEEASGRYLAHLVVAEMPVSRKPGTRPVDYDPNNQELLVLDPDGIVFSSLPIQRGLLFNSVEITSRTGMRERTNETKPRKHVGIDIRVDENETTVHAVADGILISMVDFRKHPSAQGNFVSILHDGGFVTQYLHLASFDESLVRKLTFASVNEGIYVWAGPGLNPISIKAGDTLGIAGRTSEYDIRPHLHLNVVPSGGAWNNSIDQFVVYNPEPLLAGSLVKPELITEFLFAYGYKKFKTDDVADILVGGSTRYLKLIAKDSVFRDVPLPPDNQLEVTSSDNNVAAVSIESGHVKIVVKQIGEVKIKVVYTASTQKGVKAYGELNVKLSYAPLLLQYKSEMCDIKGQFKMGRTEVTVGIWREACNNIGQDMPPAPAWGWIDSHPIVNVTFDDVKGFADWAGLRLPTLSEWYLAATDGNKWNFPWGGDATYSHYDGWDISNCVHSVAAEYKRGSDLIPVNRPKLTSTAPVGSIPAGNSPFGCSDMSGNVSEYIDDKYEKVAPGGNWANFWSIRDLSLRYTELNRGAGPYHTVGFRLAGPI